MANPVNPYTDCTTVQESLLTGAPLEPAATRHLAACAECRSFAEEISAMGSLMADYEFMPPPDFADRVAQAIGRDRAPRDTALPWLAGLAVILSLGLLVCRAGAMAVLTGAADLWASILAGIAGGCEWVADGLLVGLAGDVDAIFQVNPSLPASTLIGMLLAILIVCVATLQAGQPHA